jgi:hypothetical protein
MRLFQKSPEKAAEQEAAKAEIERLKKLRVDDMALLLMPMLGPDGFSKGYTVRVQQLCEELLRDYPGGKGMVALQLSGRVIKGLQRLQHVDLVEPISIMRSPPWRITDIGREALEDGTVEKFVKVTG